MAQATPIKRLPIDLSARAWEWPRFLSAAYRLRQLKSRITATRAQW